MNIEQARKLVYGSVVHYPADRGSPAGRGFVRHVGVLESQSLKGAAYIWVTVEQADLRRAVWPSNRLS